jgi:hypothetical protein
MEQRYNKPELVNGRTALNRMVDRRRKREHRGVISRGRKANLDESQLVFDSARQLRDPDDGLFWFIPGYSKVGGPDKIPET